MADNSRQVTGEAQGRFLADLLNQQIDKRDWRARSLQQDVHRLLAEITMLERQLAGTNTHSDDVSRLKNKLNGVLQSYAEYPQVFISRFPQAPPRLYVEFVPSERGAMRRNAIGAVCSLIRYGLLDRVRQCQRTADQRGGMCGRWFFAKKSDSIYCSRNCQVKPTEERKRQKREYAARSYREKKERLLREKQRMAGGRN